MTTSRADYTLGRQVELIYRNQKIGQIVSIAIACYMAWMGYVDQVPLVPITLWWLAASGIALLRLGLARRYLRLTPPQRLATVADWHRRVRSGALASGLIWASGALLLMAGGSLELQLFTAFIMAGMTAGGLPVLGPDRISYRLYAWPIITAVIVGVFDTDHMHLAFSTLSLTAFVIYTRSADVYARMLAETFTLEFEKGEMLAAVEQARQTAERSDRAKTEFLANISHELRTPLNGIIGIGELLSDEALSSEQKNLVALLQDNANQLSQRIDHLIELAALEAGHVQCRPSPFTVVELLEGLVSPQSEAALAKGLHIELHHASPLPDVVVGDLERLRQIFKHLVDNAIKFTDRGTISITMRQVERSAQQVSIEFSIRDTGPGISAQVQEMISGILTQGDGSLIRRHSGVGVGLPIARRLTELLGGQLEIESGMGRGSCFRFVLPFALPAEDQALA